MADDKQHDDVVGNRGSRKWGRYPPVLVIGVALLALWLVAMALGLF